MLYNLTQQYRGLVESSLNFKRQQSSINGENIWGNKWRSKPVHWDKTSQLVRARAVQASDNSNTEPGRFSPNKSHTISKPCTQ